MLEPIEEAYKADPKLYQIKFHKSVCLTKSIFIPQSPRLGPKLHQSFKNQVSGSEEGESGLEQQEDIGLDIIENNLPFGIESEEEELDKE